MRGHRHDYRYRKNSGEKSPLKARRIAE